MEDNEMILSADPTIGTDDGTAISTGTLEPVTEPTDDTLLPAEPLTQNTTEPTGGVGITIGCFFGTIQESVTIAWRYHLKTRKYSAHMALHDFYDGAIDIIDSIIEQYQGISGVVEEPFVNTIISEGKDEITYLGELKGFVMDNKFIIGDASELMSTVDDFLSLIDSTLYKLTTLTENCIKSYDEFCYEDYNIDEEE